MYLSPMTALQVLESELQERVDSGVNSRRKMSLMTQISKDVRQSREERKEEEGLKEG